MQKRTENTRFLLPFVMVAFVLISKLTMGQHHNYPIPPKTQELMFYIQRNHNANTIIYEANFDEDGNLIDDEPLKVCWLRYDEEGQRKELTNIQKWYAYGLKTKKERHKQGSYAVELVAYKERPLELIQTGINQAEIRMHINGKASVVDHLYIQADNSGIWPTVEYVELFGKEIGSQSEIYEKINNK